MRRINYDLIINKRLVLILTVIIILFCLVTFKIADVMLIKNNKYKKSLEILSHNEVTGPSSPRGRIYDRNYNIIVDNKSLKTITYKKDKNTSLKDMIEVADKISNNIEIDYSHLTLRNKKEYYCAKYKDKCDSYIKKSEIEKFKQKKLTQNDLYELKLERINEDELNFSEEENKIAYIFYLMNRGYTYDEKIIKSDVSDKEYAYVSENNEILHGFNTKIDWERVYPYGDTFKTILGKVSSSSQGIPAEDKEYYLKKGYSLNDRVGISYIEKEYEK